AELQELGAVIKSLKEEQTATRRGTKVGHSSRQERDKTEKNLRTQLTWARRFDQPGAGKKEKVFSLAKKELKDEKAAAPLSRHARSALLEEDAQEELPEPKARTRELPPSEAKVTAVKKAKKRRKERKREKRRKAEKAEKTRGRPPVGSLSAFGGNTETGSRGATDKYPGWTRVNFVVDSGASEPVGYRSFRLADGSVVANEGTLEAKAWLLGDEVLELRASVAAISQPLLSVGQVTSRGNKVILGPKVCYLETTAGKKRRIFLKHGVYILPVWMDTNNRLFELAPHPFEGRSNARL
ncbi:unnamed protein product, partial [Symbiodinium pilosum]